MTDGEITNRTIYQTIMDQILPALGTIRERLIAINGDIGRLKERANTTSQRLGQIDQACGELRNSVTRLEAGESFRSEQIRDVQEKHTVLDNRVIQVMIDVAKWGAVGLGVSGGIAKLVEVLGNLGQ